MQTRDTYNLYNYREYLKTLARGTITAMSSMDRANYIGSGRGLERLTAIENTILKNKRGQDRADLLNHMYTELRDTMLDSDSKEPCQTS
jgi:hypothetical protein